MRISPLLLSLLLLSQSTIANLQDQIQTLKSLTIRDDVTAHKQANLIHSISEIGPTAIPQILPLLKDKNPIVRESSLWILDRLGSTVTTSRSDILPLFQDPDSLVRRAAIITLHHILPASESRPLILPELQNSDPYARSAAILAIGSHSENPKTLSHILPLLQDPDSLVRWTTAQTISDFPDQAEIILPQLLPLLKDPKPVVRRMTIISLGRLSARDLGRRNRIITHIRPLLDDPEAIVRSGAKLVLDLLESAP
jgi:HEAT repeat protein